MGKSDDPIVLFQLYSCIVLCVEIVTESEIKDINQNKNDNNNLKKRTFCANVQ